MLFLLGHQAPACSDLLHHGSDLLERVAAHDLLALLFTENDVGARRFFRRDGLVSAVFNFLHVLVKLFLSDWTVLCRIVQLLKQVNRV